MGFLACLPMTVVVFTGACSSKGMGSSCAPKIRISSHPGMGSEGSKEEVAAFMEEKGYTYPTLMDEGGQISFYTYYVTAFPTTFMIDKDGNVYGYASGQLTKDMMKDIIRQTEEGRS